MVSASQRTEQSEASGDGGEVAAIAASLPRLESNLRFTSRKQSCSKIQSRIKVAGKEGMIDLGRCVRTLDWWRNDCVATRFPTCAARFAI